MTMTANGTTQPTQMDQGPAWNDRPLGDVGIFIIRVSRAECVNGEIRGEYCNTELGVTGCFESYFHLFRKIQSDLDWAARPQRATKQRSFQRQNEAPLPKDVDLELLLPIARPAAHHHAADSLSAEVRERVLRGSRQPLFFLRVIFRQNASWQGHIFWANQKSGVYFRSVMELAELIDEAVRPGQEQPE